MKEGGECRKREQAAATSVEALESIQIECSVQESLQFCVVGFLVASGGSSCRFSSSVPGAGEKAKRVKERYTLNDPYTV